MTALITPECPPASQAQLQPNLMERSYRQFQGMKPEDKRRCIAANAITLGTPFLHLANNTFIEPRCAQSPDPLVRLVPTAIRSVLSLSDLVDGKLVRMGEQKDEAGNITYPGGVTDFGKTADPTADKVTHFINELHAVLKGRLPLELWVGRVGCDGLKTHQRAVTNKKTKGAVSPAAAQHAKWAQAARIGGNIVANMSDKPSRLNTAIQLGVTALNFYSTRKTLHDLRKQTQWHRSA